MVQTELCVLQDYPSSPLSISVVGIPKSFIDIGQSAERIGRLLIPTFPSARPRDKMCLGSHMAILLGGTQSINLEY